MIIKAIDAESLHLILPFKVSQLAILYANKFGVSTTEAVRQIYKSNTYKQLEAEETKLWHLGPVGLLDTIVAEKEGKAFGPL
jgi:hypothetical protein